jgi:site-specific recombinase XerC
MVIRKVEGRAKPWMLDYGTVDGKRKRGFFETKADAEKAWRDHVRENDELGAASRLLSQDDLMRFIVAKRQLDRYSITIEDAVEFYVKHSGARKMKDPITYQELVDAFADRKKSLGRRPDYYKTMKVVGDSLARFLRNENPLEQDVMCTDVGAGEVEAWLRSSKLGASTQNSYLSKTSVIFNWAIKEGYVLSNPAGEVEEVSEDEQDIRRLTVEQCALLLRAAYNDVKRDPTKKDRAMLPYFVSGMFCGGRKTELLRSDLEQDLSEDSLTIRGKAAKLRSRRVIRLPDVAKKWLALCNLDGSFKATNWDRRFDQIREAADVLEDWPINALRKTFASMHYAYHQDEATLKAILAHSGNSTMLFRHYRDLATYEEAEKFWLLEPEVVLSDTRLADLLQQECQKP